jgi:hypothetical protein
VAYYAKWGPSGAHTTWHLGQIKENKILDCMHIYKQCDAKGLSID